MYNDNNNNNSIDNNNINDDNNIEFLDDNFKSANLEEKLSQLPKSSTCNIHKLSEQPNANFIQLLDYFF